MSVWLVCAQAEPLTWERCLVLAAEHNPQLRIAQTRFQEADGRILEFHANYLPHLGVEATTIPILARFALTQSVYNPALAPGERIAQLQRTSAQANLELTLIDLVYALRLLYLQTLYWSQLAAQQQSFADDLEKTKPDLQSLFDIGKAEKASVERLAVNQSQAATTASETATLAAQSRIQLDQLIGLDPPLSEPLAGKIEAKLPPELNVDVLTARALRQRRDLQLLEIANLSDREEIRVAGAADFPSFYLFSNLNSEPYRPSFLNGVEKFSQQSDNTNRTSFQVGLATSWRIFDGGETRGNVMQAQAASQQAQIEADRVRWDIPGQVRETVAALKTALESLEALKLGPDSSQTVALALEDFHRGKATALDLLDTQEAREREQESLLAARYQVELARATLERVTGEMVRLAPADLKSPIVPR